MADTPEVDTIGKRVQARRKLRGMSIRTLAGLAGISPSSLSRIERGLQGVDNRNVIAGLARALQCSTADLVGLPQAPADRASAEAQASVYETMQVLMETDLDEPAATRDPRPLPELDQVVWQATDAMLESRYAEGVRLLPPLLRDLHAHTGGPERADALRLLAHAMDKTAVIVRFLGYPGESWVAAERSRDVANALGDPVIQGLAAWTRGHAATSASRYELALRITRRGLDAVRDAKGQGASEMRGLLHLLIGWTEYSIGHRGDAEPHLREADALAREIGHSLAMRISFGPGNADIWRLSMATEAGDPKEAVAIGRNLQGIGGLPKIRQATAYIDLGRALASLRRDDEATRLLLNAERLAPQRLDHNPMVSETVRVLQERDRQRDPSGINGLAERLGVGKR